MRAHATLPLPAPSWANSDWALEAGARQPRKEAGRPWQGGAAWLARGRDGDRNGPTGRLWPGGLQPGPLCLLYHLDHHSALHGERPPDPQVLPAPGILRDHPRGRGTPLAAVRGGVYHHHLMEEPEERQEGLLKAAIAWDQVPRNPPGCRHPPGSAPKN